MNDDQLFERKARVWLELGPTSAPKRVVEAALLTVQTTPQQRDLRAPWRFPRMTMNTRFAVAAAVGLLAIGAGLLILRSPQSQVGTPSPSATTVNSPSPSAVSAAALQATWASVGSRVHPGIESDLPIAFSLDSSILRIPQPHVDVDNSWSLIDGGSQLLVNFQTTFPGLSSMPTGQLWGCQIGDEGIYSLSLSQDGATLTLNLASDVCAERAAILAGAWTRWACPDAFDCDLLTDLSPGRHVAPIFKPFDNGVNGQFSYTLPDGWAYMAHPPTWPETEWNKRIDLLRNVDAGAHSISVFSSVLIRSQDPIPDSQPVSCTTTAPHTGASPAQVADWLASLDGLDVTARRAVTIGGLNGVMVDLALTPGWTNPCESSQEGNGPPVFDGPRHLFFSPVLDYDEGLNVNVDDRARYILLDRRDGQILLIRVQTQGKTAWDALIADAMPVIQTFEFMP